MCVGTQNDQTIAVLGENEARLATSKSCYGTGGMTKQLEQSPRLAQGDDAGGSMLEALRMETENGLAAQDGRVGNNSMLSPPKSACRSHV